jgi:hypothetical protein
MGEAINGINQNVVDTPLKKIRRPANEIRADRQIFVCRLQNLGKTQ